MRTEAKLGPNERLRDDWFTVWIYHRFLTRVFCSPSKQHWALKGGTAALVYSSAARSTRDIDLQATKLGIENATRELFELLEQDLGDFLEFRYHDRKGILLNEEQPEVDGVRLRFDVLFGGKKQHVLNVDITAISEQLLMFAERRSASEIEIPGLNSIQFRVISLESQVAEKIAIMIQNPGRNGTTRGKDLYDLVFYASRFQIERAALMESLKLSLELRNLAFPSQFTAPISMQESFTKLVEKGGIPPQLESFHHAETFVQKFVAFGAQISETATWHPETLSWHDQN